MAGGKPSAVLLQRTGMMKKIAVLLILIAGCLWGTMGLFVRYFNNIGLSSMEIVEFRAAFTALIVSIGLLFADRKQLRIRIKDTWCFLGTGVLSILIFNYCYFKAMSFISLNLAAMLLYTSPIFIMLISAAIFKEKITPIKVVALACSFGGCALVCGVFTGTVAASAQGITLGVCAGFTYALYSIFSRFAINKGYTSYTITAYTFIFAATAGSIPANFDKIGAAVANHGAGILLLMLFCAIVTSVLPYIIYTYGLAYIENSKAAVIVAVELVMSTAIGIIVFGELLTFAVIVGIALVLTSIIILNK